MKIKRSKHVHHDSGYTPVVNCKLTTRRLVCGTETDIQGVAVAVAHPQKGSMESFCEKLADKGFTKLGNDNNTTLFVGDFTGRNSTVGIIADDDGENVYSVVVLFDSSDEWKVLVNTYDYYKDLYTRKYGKPKVSIEKNKELMSTSPNNGLLMIELDERRATWGSLWEVTGGEIEINIEKTDGYLEGAVVIRYRDAQNEEAKIQKHLEDI